MQTVSLEALERSLEKYLRRVESGEAVAVTVEGRIVAEIRPPGHAAHSTGLEEATAPYSSLPRESECLAMQDEPETWEERGVREGWLRPAKRSEPWPPPRHPIPGMTPEKLLEELGDDGEDGV